MALVALFIRDRPQDAGLIPVWRRPRLPDAAPAPPPSVLTCGRDRVLRSASHVDLLGAMLTFFVRVVDEWPGPDPLHPGGS